MSNKKEKTPGDYYLDYLPYVSREDKIAVFRSTFQTVANLSAIGIVIGLVGTSLDISSGIIEFFSGGPP